MPVEVRCANPGCGRRYQVPSRVVGKSLECKVCGQRFVAGGTAPTEAREPDETLRTGFVPEVPAPATPPPLAAAPTRAADESFLEPAWEPVRSSQPTVTAATSQTPGTIGRFAIRGKLGAGAFGTVLRAYDPQLDRVVALKVPNPGVMANAKQAERFLREAKAAANLRHPHIVPVFDAGKDGETYYIASAFIDGKPLSDDIPDGGTDFQRAARLARELAEALAYAHEQGIVHRDVKPQNIMLDNQDRVHLMDFGLAARQDEEAKLTRDGAVMGTPAYMAPEQAKGQSADVTPAADQYAAGVVLYELLTGEVPFKGPTPVVLHNVIHTDPDPVRKSRADVPKDLETICLKAMAKRPEERYASCQELADDLRRWLEGEPILARRQSLPERVVRGARKEPKLAAALAVVLAVLVGSFLVVSRSATQANAARVRAESALADRDAALSEQAAAEARAAASADKTLGALGTAAEERAARIKAEAQALAAEAQALAAEGQARAAESKARATQGRAEAAEGQARAAEGQARALSAVLIEAGARCLGTGDVNTASNLLRSVPPKDRNERWKQVFARIPWQNSLTLNGHSDIVRAACFSPDGSRALTAGNDRTARVWDTRAGAEVFALQGHTGWVWAACFSPDGARALTASWDRTARVWDAKTGAEVFALKGHAGTVNAACFSPDGSRVLTASDDGTARVWDAKTGAAVLTLTGHTRTVNAAAWSPDGSMVLTASGDRTARVWDAKTGAEVFALKGHTGTVNAACFSPDGARALTASNDQTARVWDAKTGGEVRALKGHADVVNAACFSPDGSQVLTASDDGTARVWDAKTGAAVLTLTGHTGGVRAASFSPDGSMVLTASGDRTARVWDTKTGAEVFALKGHIGGVSMASWSPDGTRVLTASGDRTARVWEELPPIK